MKSEEPILKCGPWRKTSEEEEEEEKKNKKEEEEELMQIYPPHAKEKNGRVCEGYVLPARSVLMTDWLTRSRCYRHILGCPRPSDGYRLPRRHEGVSNEDFLVIR